MFSLFKNHKHIIRLLILAITLSVYGLAPAASAKTPSATPSTLTTVHTIDTNISIISISTKDQTVVTVPNSSAQSNCSQQSHFISFTENGLTDFNRLFTCAPIFVTVADVVKASLKVNPAPTASVRLYVEQRGPSITAAPELIPGLPETNTQAIITPLAENLKEQYVGIRNGTITVSVAKTHHIMTAEIEPEILNIFRC